MPKASLLTEAIQIIESIFAEIEKYANEGGHAFQDIQGDVYEMLLGEIATAGKNGQFRTPRHIIKLIAELVAPQLGQRVADPACGTGGFLLGAYQFMLTDCIRKKDPKKIVKDEAGFERGTLSSVVDKRVKSVLDDSFYGYDIDTTMVRLGLMNLMMHGIDEPHIDYKDTLSKKFNEDKQYDIVLANPPFTGNIDQGDINESLTLSGNYITERRVFKPYAGVSTAILIFTKANETEYTWFYEMKVDGYSLDDKRVKIEQSDLMDIVSRFQSRNPKKDTKRTEKSFFVPKQEIIENGYDFSLSKYKEEIYEEIEYESPKLILEKLGILEGQIQIGLKKLKSKL
ncbi:N-6 DNA methylase [Leptospira santarosai]